MEETKKYNGFWKKLGCTFSVVAALVVIALTVGVGGLFYNLWQAFLLFMD